LPIEKAVALQSESSRAKPAVKALFCPERSSTEPRTSFHAGASSVTHGVVRTTQEAAAAPQASVLRGQC